MGNKDGMLERLQGLDGPILMGWGGPFVKLYVGIF